jgi:[protein-PII] uridylyltransferase
MASLALGLKEQLKAGRQATIAEFKADGKPEKLLMKLRQGVDAALIQAWKVSNLPASAALVAANCSPIPTSTC